MSFQSPISVKQVVDRIDSNQYLLPAIQREFVWGSDQIELLFDSLMKNYPIGTLLMWKVQGENKTNRRYYSVLKKYREKYHTHCQEINTNAMNDFEAILDGQQRMTALYIGLKGSYAFKRRYARWADNEDSIPTKKLYLCLSKNSINEDENEDGRAYNFCFLTKFEIDGSDKIWFEVGKILSFDGTYEINEFLKDQQWSDDRYISQTIFKLFDIIHVNLLINYYLESDQDYDKALNIFIRVNKGGEKLSYSDMIMSTITSDWESESVSARDEFNGLIDEIWDSTKIEIDKDFIIRSYLLIFSEDIRFRVTNFSLKNAEEFKKEWRGIRSAIVETLELVQDFGYVEKTLTSKNALLPIVYYLFASGKSENFTSKISCQDDRNFVKRWLHAVLLHKIFGGQADMVLKNIRDTIKNEINNSSSIFPAAEIAKSLAGTRKSISVDDEFIESLLYITSQDRYAFSILALLYPNLDYKNNDFHKDHIHPVSKFKASKLKKAGIDLTQENGDYFTEELYFNGIVNLQMLDGSENKSKGDIDLDAWVKSCDVDFDKQILPQNTNFERFAEFVDERWEMLRRKLIQELKF